MQHPDRIIGDRGPTVLMGFYLWGSRHGAPVDPTASAPNISNWSWAGEQFSNESKRT